VFNPQTGLFEQSVTVTNNAGGMLDAVRVMVYDLRPDTQVFNRSGMIEGIPHVNHNSRVLPGDTVSMVIEYYSPTRTPPVPRLVAEAVSPQAPIDPAGVPVAITRRLGLADGTFLIEFNSLKNRIYFVQYAEDLDQWKTATPGIVGTGTSLQWIDNGPPKTDRHPREVTARYYRIVLMPLVGPGE
jgi:hypothetical protein